MKPSYLLHFFKMYVKKILWVVRVSVLLVFLYLICSKLDNLWRQVGDKENTKIKVAPTWNAHCHFKRHNILLIIISYDVMSFKKKNKFMFENHKLFTRFSTCSHRVSIVFAPTWPQEFRCEIKLHNSHFIDIIIKEIMTLLGLYER